MWRKVSKVSKYKNKYSISLKSFAFNKQNSANRWCYRGIQFQDFLVCFYCFSRIIIILNITEWNSKSMSDGMGNCKRNQSFSSSEKNKFCLQFSLDFDLIISCQHSSSSSHTYQVNINLTYLQCWRRRDNEKWNIFGICSLHEPSGDVRWLHKIVSSWLLWIDRYSDTQTSNAAQFSELRVDSKRLFLIVRGEKIGILCISRLEFFASFYIFFFRFTSLKSRDFVSRVVRPQKKGKQPKQQVESFGRAFFFSQKIVKEIWERGWMWN